MEHKIKEIASNLEEGHIKDLVKKHINGIYFENSHLTLFVDNASALHELEEKNTDKTLCNALEKVYGEDITYEFKLEKSHGIHEREKAVPHNIK